MESALGESIGGSTGTSAPPPGWWFARVLPRIK